jgi:hypothetical protein
MGLKTMYISHKFSKVLNFVILLWRAGYIPGDRLTSWVYSTTCVQYLYTSCYISDNKPVLSYLLLCLLPQWWPQSGDRLYPLHCTLYCCTITRQQPSALVTLPSAFVSDFCFKFCSVHSIGYNFHSTFCSQFCLEINSFFPNSFFCWKWAKSYHNARLWTHYSLLLVYPLSTCTVSTLFALTCFCVSHFSRLIFFLF